MQSAPLPGWVPMVTMAVIVGPVAAGVLGVMLPAVGYHPVLGQYAITFEPFVHMSQVPGLTHAAFLSLWTGFASTVLALALAVILLAGQSVFHAEGLLSRLTPWLAVPHVAVAFGLAFLLAPSGWSVRLIWMITSGGDLPPDWVTIRDPAGLSLIVGLALKETVYLTLVMVAVVPRLDVDRRLNVARSLGYSAPVAWLKVVFPALYTQVRLPVLVVLSYGIGNVDMALILGPQTPPPLAVLVLRLLTHPDLGWHAPAAAGAVMQVALVFVAFGVWRLAERAVCFIGRFWLTSGSGPGARGQTVTRRAFWVGRRLLSGLFQGVLVAVLLILLVWSLAHGWFFPDVWPAQWTGRHWQQVGPQLWQAGGTSLWIALVSMGLSCVLVVCTLEVLQTCPSRLVMWVRPLCYIPLLMPQIAFLYGFQVVLTVVGLAGSSMAVVWAHMVFVMPYMLLSLSQPYGALNPEYRRVAQSLGAGPWRRWLMVVVPLLRGPILTACAIGFSVSLALYLPTLFAGAGRYATLTTEALVLASGGNRAVTAVLALALAVLPLCGFMVLVFCSRVLSDRPTWRPGRRQSQKGAL